MARGWRSDSKDPDDARDRAATPASREDAVKETCRRIRLARSLWDAHRNAACRGEREKALAMYEALSKDERARVPEALRVWLRYRSEKYFGPHTTPPKPRGRGPSR
jgi:hypothetical protein